MVPVIKKASDGTEEIVWLKFDDICGWGLDGERTTCFTPDEEYYWLKDMEDFNLLKGCVRTDRASIIKVDKVKRYDKNLKTLHFHETNHKPFTTVSRGRKSEVENKLKSDGRVE